MSLPDSTLAGRIAAILDRTGTTKAAAVEIGRLLKREQRLVSLKVAPSALNLSPRTFYRRLKAGKLRTLETPDGRMVDVGSKMAVGRA